MTDLLQRIQNAKDTAPRGKRLAKVLANAKTFYGIPGPFWRGMDGVSSVSVCDTLVFIDDTLPDDAMEFVYEDVPELLPVTFHRIFVTSETIY